MGLVTDVCLKRKVRNYVQIAKGLVNGFDIFIKEKAVLNTLIDNAHDDSEVKNAKDKIEAARRFMCNNYFDIRTFGAVMSTGKNAGQVRGPIQFTFAHGFISANLAQQTGFSEEDLELFWNALKNMFDVDRSAARGLMSAQKLIVFKHDSILGNAPANKLFELVKVEKVCDGAPRSFIDYSVTIDKENAPSNVTIEELI